MAPSSADTHAGGDHIRVITFRYREIPGFAIQVARSLEETDRALDRIKWLLIVIAFGGILVAAGLGLAWSRARPSPRCAG